MGMNGNDMATAVVSAIESVDPSMTPDQITQLTNSWDAICTAIVGYIQGHAVVNPGTFTNSGGAVTGTGTVG